MFAIFRLSYLRQYTTYFKLSYIYVNASHQAKSTHISHIYVYNRSTKTRKFAAKSSNQPNQPGNVFFCYAKLATHEFEVNHENAMLKYV